ncbi:MAG: hypothetical protein R3C02_16070 [Planctomycetaceae bacterium]
MRFANGTDEDFVIGWFVCRCRADDVDGHIEPIECMRIVIQESGDRPLSPGSYDVVRPVMNFAAEAAGTDDDEALSHREIERSTKSMFE